MRRFAERQRRALVHRPDGDLERNRLDRAACDGVLVDGSLAAYDRLVGAGGHGGGDERPRLAIMLDASIAGAMATMAGVCFMLAVLFAPQHGVVAQAQRRARQRHQFETEIWSCI